MNITSEKIKELVKKYPYLRPKNIWTGEDVEFYDYSYYEGQYELPVGWSRLFLLYCKSIRSLLQSYNYINIFRFSQIKEKNGRMCLYSMGYPSPLSDITTLYESFSKYVCPHCGRIVSDKTKRCVCLCSSYNHMEKLSGKEHYKYATIYKYHKGSCYKTCYSYKSMKQEFKFVSNMTDEEFIDYIIGS